MDSRVAQRIRELIVEGVLPPGTRVAEATIAERLGVSRTPVRNTLPALAAEGLLEPAGKRGYAVRHFSHEDSYKATEIRCVLEGYAARELAARDDRSDRARASCAKPAPKATRFSPRATSSRKTKRPTRR